MFPAIRHGFASTVDMFAAWWRAHGARGPAMHVRVASSVASPSASPTASALATPASPTERPPSATHAEDALRRFLACALDPDGTADPVPLQDEHRALIESASIALERLEVQARYLPRRPSLLPRLLSAMNNDSNSMRELAVIIGDDPALMGNLVRLANSAFYRGVRKSIESLERAVTLVGTDGLRGLIATALLHPVMTTRSGLFASFPETVWEQTLYAADAAEMHAVHVERINGFGARLLALLDGLATNTVFRIVRDECLHDSAPTVKPAVVALLREWAPPISRRIAGTWEMPNELLDALDAPPEQCALQRSMSFGRLAGAQILMTTRGRVKESAARASVLAVDDRRMQVDRVWARLAAAHLKS